MFGQKPRLNPLEARKQLLIAESEINRAQLSQEWQALARGVHDLAQRTKTITAWASAAALLVAGLTAWRSGPPASGAAKPSWFQKILHGARLASTIWVAFRACGRKEEPQ
ncbi:MAG: hypothetical protein NTW03_19480 [Verrucomicrobia bacterium]|nr:hypothetical protein [Verrucomicrobiota bacterium]